MSLPMSPTGCRQRSPKPDKAELGRRVEAMLELVRLGGYGARRIWELSGGQQQRVALARALVNRPTVLLLDEPLAALDRKLRRDMQIELQNLQREVGITFVLVTHDQEEALSMSDTICVLRSGPDRAAGIARRAVRCARQRLGRGFRRQVQFPGRHGRGARRGHRPGGGGRPSVPGPSLAGRTAVAAGPARRAGGAAGTRARRAAAPGCAGGWRVLNRIFLGEHTEYLVRTAGLGDLLALVPRAAEGGWQRLRAGRRGGARLAAFGRSCPRRRPRGKVRPEGET